MEIRTPGLEFEGDEGENASATRRDGASEIEVTPRYPARRIALADIAPGAPARAVMHQNGAAAAKHRDHGILGRGARAHVEIVHHDGALRLGRYGRRGECEQDSECQKGSAGARKPVELTGAVARDGRCRLHRLTSPLIVPGVQAGAINLKHRTRLCGQLARYVTPDPPRPVSAVSRRILQPDFSVALRQANVKSSMLI